MYRATSQKTSESSVHIEGEFAVAPNFRSIQPERVYEQFGLWWVFRASTPPGESPRQGPFPDRDAAERALDGYCRSMLMTRSQDLRAPCHSPVPELL